MYDLANLLAMQTKALSTYESDCMPAFADLPAIFSLCKIAYHKYESFPAWEVRNASKLSKQPKKRMLAYLEQELFVQNAEACLNDAIAEYVQELGISLTNGTRLASIATSSGTMLACLVFACFANCARLGLQNPADIAPFLVWLETKLADLHSTEIGYAWLSEYGMQTPQGFASILYNKLRKWLELLCKTEASLIAISQRIDLATLHALLAKEQ